MVPVNMFWHGADLGRMERACMKSFHVHGHDIILHGYERPKNTPDFVKFFDASNIMPLEELYKARLNNSISLGSNRYRYKILQKGMGIYADVDVFCLKKIQEADYIFGWESSNSINGAILGAPKESVLVSELIQATDNKHFIPPWMTRRYRMFLSARRMVGFPLHVSDMSWGVWGPRLLTHLVIRHGLQSGNCSRPWHFPLL